MSCEAELERQLLRIVGQDDQAAVADPYVAEAYLADVAQVAAHRLGLAAAAGDVDLQSVYVDAGEGAAQQLERRARHLEARDFEHRRRLVLARHAKVRAGHGDTWKQRHRQGLDLDAPVEARFEERLDFARHAARGPLGVEQREAGADDERHRHEHADRNPQQPYTHSELR